jgi:general secretion pathway protein G
LATLRRSTKAVFFPWEKRSGVLGMLQRTRVRVVLFVVAVLAIVIVIRSREEHDASVRATRASISTAFFAIQQYRADHSGACPRDLNELPAGGYVRDVPVDAWGKPLRLVCPGRRDPKGFDLSSDGPDGIPGGLDQVQ